MIITVTDLYTDNTATIDSNDFADTVRSWFPSAPEEISRAIAHVQDNLNRFRKAWETDLTYLGLKIN